MRIEREPAMSHQPHDPVQRLNEHHADDLLAVARALDAVARATITRRAWVAP